MTRRTVFGSLLGFVFLVNLARVVFAPLYEPLRQSFSPASEAALGAIATLAWLGSAVPRLPTGYLLSYVSRERVVLGSGLVLTTATAAMSFANSIQAVMVGAFLMGLASGVYFIAANPLVSELYPGRVGTYLGVHGSAAQIAAVIAPTFVVASVAVGDWRTTVRVMAVATAVTTVAFVLAIRETEMPDAGTDDDQFLAAARHQWRVVLTAVAVIGLTGLVWNGLFNHYIGYLLSKGFGSGTANLLLTVVFAAGVPAFAITGRVADRVPNVALMLVIVSGFVGCVLALTVVQGLLAVGLLSAVLGYVIHSLFVAVDTYLLGSLPDHHRASAYAVYSATMMLVQAMGSLIVGLLLDAGVTFDHIFTGFAVVLTIVVLALAGLHRAERLPSGARS